MRYHALACDFDGTLAWNGQVDRSTLAALERVRRSKRRLILVTGRILTDLIAQFPHVEVFDRVVAENGAVIYDPASARTRVMGERPPQRFIDDLEARKVGPITIGDVILATWHPHEAAVLETIAMHGLEHQIIFNKGAVMVLPPGINKATGLMAALEDLHLSLRNTVCVGDAENDFAMFRECEVAVAVANALVTVKQHADLVMTQDHGAGVVELIDTLIETDLRDVETRLSRHFVLLGWRDDGRPVHLCPRTLNMLLTGSPASGKSMFAAGMLDRLLRLNYQALVIDPEGDYERMPRCIHLGHERNPPSVTEVMRVLQHSTQSVTVNLLATAMDGRKAFFEKLFPEIVSLQAQAGRPHRIIVDEAHHLLTAHPDAVALYLDDIVAVTFITVDPAHLPAPALESVDLVLGFGEAAIQCLQSVSEVTGRELNASAVVTPEAGSALAWLPKQEAEPFWIRCAPCGPEHRRHRRKYAEGDMGVERSFYFRGPGDRVNVQARNLITFMDIADSVDDDIWLHHLDRHDYSNWIASAVGAPDLAGDIVGIENDRSLTAHESRARIRSAIECIYAPPP